MWSLSQLFSVRVTRSSRTPGSSQHRGCSDRRCVSYAVSDHGRIGGGAGGDLDSVHSDEIDPWQSVGCRDACCPGRALPARLTIRLIRVDIPATTSDTCLHRREPVSIVRDHDRGVSPVRRPTDVNIRQRRVSTIAGVQNAALTKSASTL